MALLTAISDAAEDRLNRLDTSAQKDALGTVIQSTQAGVAVLETGALYVLSVNITAAANSTAATISVPFACEVVDVVVQARATSGSGTATLRKTTTAITNAIVMDTDLAITRAGTIDDAQSTLAAGDNLNVITAGANDRGLVSVFVRRTA